MQTNTVGQKNYCETIAPCALLSFFCLLLLFSCHSISHAATAQQQIDKQLRSDSEKQIFERLRRQQEDRITPYLELQVPDAEESSDDPCFPVEKIDVSGASLMSPTQIAQITEKYLGECRRISDLKLLTTDINNWYMDAGYITSLAYLDQQDITDHQIDITVLEGKVESFDDPIAVKPNGVFWGQTNDYLNLRDLEVSVDRMNRLPSHQSKIDLQPGSEKGLTVVKVTTEKEAPWSLNTSVNNFGSKSTGRTQWNVSLNWDNTLGLYDQITLSKGINTPFKDSRRSQNHSISYSIPLGRLLASYRYSRSAYRQPIDAGVITLQSKGKTRNHLLSMDYRLYHDKNHKLDIESSLNRYEARNYLDDALLEASSFNLVKTSVTLKHLYHTQSLTTALSLSYLQGIDGLGAFHNTDLDETYQSWQLDGSLTKQWKHVNYSGSLHYQHAEKDQFSANQVSMGGPYSVRGYKKEGLYGNTGGYWRNEFIYPFDLEDGVTGDLYAGIDAGWVKKDDSSQSGTLVGNAIGLRLKIKDSNIDLYYSEPIRNEDVTETDEFLGVTFSLAM